MVKWSVLRHTQVIKLRLVTNGKMKCAEAHAGHQAPLGDKTYL